jgi:Na+-transporting NADH:ubiquinone oxidoreductase subunit A
VKLKVKKGLDIPIKGEPRLIEELVLPPAQIALNLDPFEEIRFRLLRNAGDKIALGEPLLENKSVLGQFFVSPASGTIKEIRRGLKRRLVDIVIELDDNERIHTLPSLDPRTASREQILERCSQGGLFAHIRMRPLNLLAKPDLLPRDIFVRAIETLPFTPSAESQVEGYEQFFHQGLESLKKLTEGGVHLVYREGSTCKAFTEAKDVHTHQISGPHPAGSISFSIHKIAPIRHINDIVWTLSTLDVITLGRMVTEGRYHIERKVAVAGEGIEESKRKIYKTRMGVPLCHLLSKEINTSSVRIISGDPLTGEQKGIEDFLGFEHTVLSVLKENHEREPFHFLSLGTHKFTATRCYLSGLLPTGAKDYSFTTNQHGEERAFIDGRVYNKVMPMRIPTMLLVKAILAEDFDLAEQLGLLEVVPEDFALPTFICPSKIEMMEIVKQGQRRYALEVGL